MRIGLILCRGLGIMAACCWALLCAVSAGATDFDFAPFQQLLDRYLQRDQVVGAFSLNTLGYGALAVANREADSPYGRLLEGLADFDPNRLGSREARIAFWLNAYNIGAIKMILDHYPVDSIRSTKIQWLKNPWNKKVLTVGGRTYSLGEIEHDILLGRLAEPLAHFAMVCASLSCPELRYEVYRPESLNNQLVDQARRFLADPVKGLRVDRQGGTVWFSKIFSFDKKTFPRGATDAIPLISRFVATDEARYLTEGDYKIGYLDYDWRLNGH